MDVQILYKQFKKTFGVLAFVFVAISCTFDDGYFKGEPNVDPSLLPQADFSAATTEIDQEETITFTNQSNGNAKLFTWRFEGANPTESTEENPTVEYPIPGEFKVYLKVRNDFGTDEITKEGYIIVKSTSEPLDPSITVRMNFENGLLNEGSIGGTGVSTGAPVFDTGIVGEGSYVFDGTNPVTISGYNGVNGTNPRTVTAWVKTTSTTRKTITHWGAQAIGSRASFVMDVNGTIRYEVAGGGINGVTAINDGEWHHVAHVFDGVDTVRLYVDGNEDALWTTGIINTGVGGETEVEIGSQLGSNIFDGNMDDVRIYDTAVDAGEIGILAAQPKLTVRMNFENGLLNEGSIGGAGVSTGTPAFDTGIVGEGSYVFNGTNPVTISGYNGVNGTNPRTVTAWVKTTSTTRKTITHWGAQAIGSRASFVMDVNGTIRYEVAGGGINGVTTINDGEWHHVAHVFDGVDTVRLYVDGNEDALWTTDIINTGVGGETEVEIGSQFGSNVFDGNMDDVRIYTSVVSAGGILILSNNQ